MAGGTLSPQQIAQYAYNAGFRGKALDQAVQIALAESAGRVDAYNPELGAGTKKGSGSRGLWQIYGAAHPWANSSAVFDPQANANAAYRVFVEAGNRFTPWSTYNKGLAKVTRSFNVQGVTQGKPITPSASPVAQIARGSSAPIQTDRVEKEKGGRIGEGPATPTLRSFLGLPEPTESDTGPRDISDFVFIGVGSVLFIIGLIFLLSLGYGAAGAKQGEIILKNASKIGAAAV